MIQAEKCRRELRPWTGGRFGFKPRGESGAAAVEFAVVLPVLVLLVMGIVEFTQAYNAKEMLQYAAREGARDLALGHTEGVAVATTRSRAATISKEVKANPALIDVDTDACPSPLPPVPPGGTPPAAEVTARYALSYSIPFFAEGKWKLEATAAMRCAG